MWASSGVVLQLCTQPALTGNPLRRSHQELASPHGAAVQTRALSMQRLLRRYGKAGITSSCLGGLSLGAIDFSFSSTRRCVPMVGAGLSLFP